MLINMEDAGNLEDLLNESAQKMPLLTLMTLALAHGHAGLLWDLMKMC